MPRDRGYSKFSRPRVRVEYLTLLYKDLSIQNQDALNKKTGAVQQPARFLDTKGGCNGLLSKLTSNVEPNHGHFEPLQF